MGGGLMQLVAYGAQDVYLSGNPQITFFKVVYRRHTNFAVEPIPQTWNGVGDFGRTVTCNINRNGDLITNMYLYVRLSDTTGTNGVVNSSNESVPWGYVRRLGHALVNNYKIEIGGSLIDQQYGDWLNIWYELTHKTGQARGYAHMIGDTNYLRRIDKDGKNPTALYVPFQFWFNRNNGLALPLIALQYHDVRITCQLRDRMQCVNVLGSGSGNKFSSSQGMEDCNLLIDYVYLDSEERKRFAQASHEYLIEQLQFTGSESLVYSGKYRLNFNHPCKFLLWAPHFQRYSTGAQWLGYATDGDWKVAKDRFAKYLAAVCTSGLKVSLTTSGASSIKIDVDGGDDITPNADSITTVMPGEIVDLANIHNGLYGNVGKAVKWASSGNTNVLYNLLSKIDVKAILQQGSTATAADTVIAKSSVGQLDCLLQFERNTIVTRNELTMEDISLNVADLENLIETGSLASGTTDADAAVLLKAAGMSCVDYFNYGNMVDGSDNPLYTGKLQLNGHDRFQDRDGNYFNYVQPYQHFSNTPADGINVYSFALKPEDHQPTGTCNFSRIDNATLLVDVGLYNRTLNTVGASDSNSFKARTGYVSNASSILNIYTVNYNVLRVMSGMAGTAYSN
jgi:hypothetical protein